MARLRENACRLSFSRKIRGDTFSSVYVRVFYHKQHEDGQKGRGEAIIACSASGFS